MQDGYLNLERFQATILVVVDLVKYLVNDSVDKPIEEPALHTGISLYMQPFKNVYAAIQLCCYGAGSLS